MAVDLKVPSVGESINEVFIGTWLKQEGDSVEKDEALVEVETDKATLEVPAPNAGVLSKILKQEGDTADVGEVIAEIDESGAAQGDSDDEDDSDSEEAAKADAAEDSEDKEDAETEEDSAEAKDESQQDDESEETDEDEAQAESQDEDKGEGEGHIMPAAQRLLDENDLSADQISGSGPGGRIQKDDVQRYLDQGKAKPSKDTDKQEAKKQDKKQESKQPAKDKAPSSSSGDREEEAVAMSPLRRTIARRLVEAQQTAALLTTFNEVDMSTMMALRNEYKEMFEKRYDVRLGFMSFFIKAAIDALKQFPAINAEIRENDIVYKNYYDVAIAVSSKKGLVTPVIRNAERLSFAEIEKTIADFGQRAQNNKLSPDELTGGTFTISNGGVFGSLMSTPIVNPPQSGVLGMHATQERPVVVDGEIVIRPMMYVALTYDHRIVDGREAVTFLKRIKEAIERPARMLIEV